MAGMHTLRRGPECGTTAAGESCQSPALPLHFASNLRHHRLLLHQPYHPRNRGHAAPGAGCSRRRRPREGGVPPHAQGAAGGVCGSAQACTGSVCPLPHAPQDAVCPDQGRGQPVACPVRAPRRRAARWLHHSQTDRLPATSAARSHRRAVPLPVHRVLLGARGLGALRCCCRARCQNRRSAFSSWCPLAITAPRRRWHSMHSHRHTHTHLPPRRPGATRCPTLC